MDRFSSTHEYTATISFVVGTDAVDEQPGHTHTHTHGRRVLGRKRNDDTVVVGERQVDDGIPRQYQSCRRRTSRSRCDIGRQRRRVDSRRCGPGAVRWTCARTDTDEHAWGNSVESIGQSLPFDTQSSVLSHVPCSGFFFYLFIFRCRYPITADAECRSTSTCAMRRCCTKSARSVEAEQKP